jgi:hypothetical protein
MGILIFVFEGMNKQGKLWGCGLDCPVFVSAQGQRSSPQHLYNFLFNEYWG